MNRITIILTVLPLSLFATHCGDAINTNGDSGSTGGEDRGSVETDIGNTGRHDGGDAGYDAASLDDVGPTLDGGNIHDGAVGEDVPEALDGGEDTDAGSDMIEDGGTEIDGSGDNDRDAGYDDVGIPDDGGSAQCVGEGQDCTVSLCCAGLECNGIDQCVVAGSCVEVSGQCQADQDCCMVSEPNKGIWCNEYALCTVCGRKNGTCTSDYDCCPGATPLMCTSRKTCQPICKSSSDCPVGSTCLTSGECTLPACSSDVQCPGQKCCSGECQNDCGYGTATACMISTPGGVISAGNKVTLHAVAYSGDPKVGGQIIPWSGISWSTSDAAKVFVDQSTGEITGGATPGTAQISANSGSFDCGSVSFTNYLPVASGSVRVVVLDEKHGTPMQGADVVISGSAPQKTNSAGEVLLTTQPGDVHVFHKDYSWVSVIGLAKSDYVIHLPPLKNQNAAGGFAGGFDSALFSSGWTNLGRACTSYTTDPLEWGLQLQYSLFSFDLALRTGCDEPILTHHKMETSKGAPADYDDWGKSPGGLYVDARSRGVSEPAPEYRVLGEEGFRSAWGLVNTVSSRDATKFITITGKINSNFEFPMGIFITTLFPIVDSFSHAVISLFEVTPIPKIPTPKSSTGQPLVDTSTMADYAQFPQLALGLTSKLLLATVISLPSLPKLQGRCVRGVYIEGGANLPGIGMVPLGKAAGLDNPDDTDIQGDCVINKLPNAPTSMTDGQILFRMAPGHHGLEANPYRIFVLAAELGAPSTVEADNYQYIPVGGSLNAISGRVINDSKASDTYDLSVSKFFGFPEGASLARLTRKITGPSASVTGATFYRYKVGNTRGDWYIYTPDYSKAITLPSVPAGLDDRVPAGEMAVSAVGLGGGTLAKLVTSEGSSHLDRLADSIESFSRLTCLKKLTVFDTDYQKKCNPSDPNKKDPACSPPCELK